MFGFPSPLGSHAAVPDRWRHVIPKHHLSCGTTAAATFRTHPVTSPWKHGSTSAEQSATRMDLGSTLPLTTPSGAIVIRLTGSSPQKSNRTDVASTRSRPDQASEPFRVRIARGARDWDGSCCAAQHPSRWSSRTTGNRAILGNSRQSQRYGKKRPLAKSGQRRAGGAG